jgi:hypothetical protein
MRLGRVIAGKKWAEMNSQDEQPEPKRRMGSKSNEARIHDSRKSRAPRDGPPGVALPPARPRRPPPKSPLLSPDSADPHPINQTDARFPQNQPSQLI